MCTLEVCRHFSSRNSQLSILKARLAACIVSVLNLQTCKQIQYGVQVLACKHRRRHICVQLQAACEPLVKQSWKTTDKTGCPNDGTISGVNTYLEELDVSECREFEDLWHTMQCSLLATMTPQTSRFSRHLPPIADRSRSQNGSAHRIMSCAFPWAGCQLLISFEVSYTICPSPFLSSLFAPLSGEHNVLVAISISQSDCNVATRFSPTPSQLRSA